MAKEKPTLSQRKRAMLEALKSQLGVVTLACKMAGIARPTHYMWMNKFPKYREAVESLGDVTKDFAVNALHKKIKEGDIRAITFFLERQAKERGYGKEQIIEHTGNIAALTWQDFEKAYDEQGKSTKSGNKKQRRKITGKKAV